MLFLWTFYINNPKKGIVSTKILRSTTVFNIDYNHQIRQHNDVWKKSYFNISQYNCFVCVCVFLVNIKNFIQKQKNKYFGGGREGHFNVLFIIGANISGGHCKVFGFT